MGTPQNGGRDGAVVTANEITRRYGEGDTAVDALRGVSLDVGKGKLTAVMGPSGSGKSTLMHILAALDRPTSGFVTIAGTRLGQLSDNEITKLRRQHIGFIFQFFNLLPMLTAEENILLPLSLAGEKAEPGFYEDLVKRVGLSDRLSHRPSELSGGQQQRVAIARALVSRPTVVFADEPTGNLDSKTGGEILELLHDSVDDYGQTMVMVTHEARAAASADRILFLADGEIVKELGEAGEEQILETIKDVSADVIRVALRGLAGRKFRAVLTAIAIVLGVAMISGTLVLTDTIDRAFNRIFVELLRRHRRGRPLREVRHHVRGRDRRRARLLRERAPPGPRELERRGGQREHLRGDRGQDRRQGRQGDLEQRADLRVRHRSGLSAVQPARAQSGSLGVGPERGRDRLRARPKDQGYEVGDTVQVATLRPGPGLRSGRDRPVPGGVESLGGATFAVFNVPTAQRLLDRQGKLDAISVAAKGGTSPERARRAASRATCRRRSRSSTGVEQADEDSGEVATFVDFIRYFLLAFGGDRALRRRVRHLQHALDHGRAADARARDAADARRLAAAAPRLGPGSRRS